MQTRILASGSACHRGSIRTITSNCTAVTMKKNITVLQTKVCSEFFQTPRKPLVDVLWKAGIRNCVGCSDKELDGKCRFFSECFLTVVPTRLHILLWRNRRGRQSCHRTAKLHSFPGAQARTLGSQAVRAQRSGPSSIRTPPSDLDERNGYRVSGQSSNDILTYCSYTHDCRLPSRMCLFLSWSVIAYCETCTSLLSPELQK